MCISNGSCARASGKQPINANNQHMYRTAATTSLSSVKGRTGITDQKRGGKSKRAITGSGIKRISPGNDSLVWARRNKGIAEAGSPPWQHIQAEQPSSSLQGLDAGALDETTACLEVISDESHPHIDGTLRRRPTIMNTIIRQAIRRKHASTAYRIPEMS